MSVSESTITPVKTTAKSLVFLVLSDAYSKHGSHNKSKNNITIW